MVSSINLLVNTAEHINNLKLNRNKALKSVFTWYSRYIELVGIFPNSYDHNDLGARFIHFSYKHKCLSKIQHN